jgi:hypothetical protein
MPTHWRKLISDVMAGLVPAILVLDTARLFKVWMPATSLA